MNTAGRFFALAVCVPLVSAAAASNGEGAPVVVDLAPTERAAWTPKNVLVGVSGVFGGWNYWYEERAIQIETVPADADLGLYYLRQNFQKRFQRAQAPASVKLPPRADMTPKDAVRFTATANGYLSEHVSFDARDVPEKVVIQLKALPNSLVFLGTTSFAGRSTLSLRSTEKLEMRMQKSAKLDGFMVAMTKTALKVDGKPTAGGGHVKQISAVQLGEDAVVRVETDEYDVEVRSRQSFDPVRSQYVYTLDLVKPGSAAPSDGQIRAQLDSVPFTPNAACDERYAELLRGKLGESAIADALRPSGGLVDLYRREAMLRLGRYEQGSVRTGAGETLRTGNPLELALALQSAANVKGYLALLGALARTQREPADALRTLIAPELTPTDFAPTWDAVEAARSGCHR